MSRTRHCQHHPDAPTPTMPAHRPQPTLWQRWCASRTVAAPDAADMGTAFGLDMSLMPPAGTRPPDATTPPAARRRRSWWARARGR